MFLKFRGFLRYHDVEKCHKVKVSSYLFALVS